MNELLKPGDEIRKRLRNLRTEMQKQAIDVLIIPSSDPHLSEYLPNYWRSRAWFSGFTGSAGTLVVGKDQASLWTDSRYWVQAEQELNHTGIVLCRITGRNSLPYLAWIRKNFPQGNVVAVDGRLVSVNQGRQLKDELEKNGFVFRTDVDPVKSVWTERPALPEAPVYEHPAEFTGLSRAEKIARVRTEMQATDSDWHLITALDDIAWMLNLRGSDIQYNPVFTAYFLLGRDKAILTVDPGKLPETLRQTLESEGVEIKPYETIFDRVSKLPEGSVLLLDPQRTTFSMSESVSEKVKTRESVNPAMLLKSRKTASEIEHVRQTMIQDGAAFCEFQAWFDTVQKTDARKTLTELTVAEKIESLRASRPYYVSPSFATIAGFNANGALPHYQATEKAFSSIEGDGLLLIDTGGQYLSGTTDMTRVIPVGLPSQEQKKDFTRVLKGLIALSETRFPRSIPAPMLDAVARQPLWEEGLDYGHGTGHGVGYFLNVHEGPQAVSYHGKPEPQTAMEEGMITSIEPGLYRPGKWGIRLENLVANRFAERTEFGDFLYFETLTQCPFDTRCIDKTELTENEIAWLNRYHERVRQNLLPYVKESVRNWLIERTKSI